jgi:hypothetical protein
MDTAVGNEVKWWERIALACSGGAVITAGYLLFDYEPAFAMERLWTCFGFIIASFIFHGIALYRS